MSNEIPKNKFATTQPVLQRNVSKMKRGVLVLREFTWSKFFASLIYYYSLPMSLSLHPWYKKQKKENRKKETVKFIKFNTLLCNELSFKIF